MTEEEIQEHLKLVNKAHQHRAVAAKQGQEAYNKATWQYAKKASWFTENSIDYHFEQDKIVLGPIASKSD